ncbi:hypothetical protein PR048_029312 [Dryococelus australis]|uniref:Uncharacterized protein n=1 Tax=Dryococelus australis TaxID=614101 RepID=A0ABQ9GD41_9NEOP|nr:hypothetical protein PR048_029312 [Dryococelus australis]
MVDLKGICTELLNTHSYNCFLRTTYWLTAKGGVFKNCLQSQRLFAVSSHFSKARLKFYLQDIPPPHANRDIFCNSPGDVATSRSCGVLAVLRRGRSSHPGASYGTTPPPPLKGEAGGEGGEPACGSDSSTARAASAVFRFDALRRGESGRAAVTSTSEPPLRIRLQALLGIRRNASKGETGDPKEKPADQRHRPVRLPRANIREQPRRSRYRKSSGASIMYKSLQQRRLSRRPGAAMLWWHPTTTLDLGDIDLDSVLGSRVKIKFTKIQYGGQVPSQHGHPRPPRQERRLVAPGFYRLFTVKTLLLYLPRVESNPVHPKWEVSSLTTTPPRLPTDVLKFVFRDVEHMEVIDDGVATSYLLLDYQVKPIPCPTSFNCACADRLFTSSTVSLPEAIPDAKERRIYDRYALFAVFETEKRGSDKGTHIKCVIVATNRRASLIARAQTYHEEVERSLGSLKTIPLQAGLVVTKHGPNITAGNKANEVFVVETLHQEDVQRWGLVIRLHASSHQPSTRWIEMLLRTPLLRLHYWMQRCLVLYQASQRYKPSILSVEFPWLTYLEDLRGALCRVCRLFRSEKMTAGKGEHQHIGDLVAQAFTRWKNAETDFRQLPTRRDAMQELALRGHQVRGPLLTQQLEENDGNLRNLRRFRIDSGDEILRQHLYTCGGNATYISPDIQNQIIDACEELRSVTSLHASNMQNHLKIQVQHLRNEAANKFSAIYSVAQKRAKDNDFEITTPRKSGKQIQRSNYDTNDDSGMKSSAQTLQEQYPQDIRMIVPVGAVQMRRQKWLREENQILQQKSYLRNSMSENRLNGLALLAVHRATEVDPEHVSDVFGRTNRPIQSTSTSTLAIVPWNLSHTNNNHQHQQQPSTPTTINTYNNHQHIQQPSTPTTTINTYNNHQHLQQPSTPTTTINTNNHQHLQQPSTPTTTINTNNNHQHQQPSTPTTTINTYNNHQHLQQPSTPTTTINTYNNHQHLQQPSTPTTTINTYNNHQHQQQPSTPTTTINTNNNHQHQQPSTPTTTINTNNNHQHQQQPSTPTTTINTNNNHQHLQQPSTPTTIINTYNNHHHQPPILCRGPNSCGWMLDKKANQTVLPLGWFSGRTAKMMGLFLRLKRCRERKINIKTPERVNVDVFTHKQKQPCVPNTAKRNFLRAWIVVAEARDVKWPVAALRGAMGARRVRPHS